MRLSRERISTFCGNVMPLRLLGGEDYNCEKITWRAEDPSVVQITVFSKNYPTGGEFTNGVLLTFLAAGKTAVTAKYAGRSYTCQVSARPMRRAVPSDEMQYFVGDMHDHTWNNHKLAEFSARAPEFYPIHHYMPCMRADGKMDFAVVSDHADIMNAREFFRGYADADQLDDSVIFFSGAEGQVTQRETDRYGVVHMHGGEILMFHADIGFETDSWEGLFRGLKRSPFAFCGYPHPQIVGISVPGIWDFHHQDNHDERFQKLFRFVEMGDGTHRSCNVINEHTYSCALDAGLHVSPTCASDGHGPGRWGYDRVPGKTILMAVEKSKEAFLDAIQNNRMYASSTGNVKLRYTVNDRAAPATLCDEGVYRFHVELDYFRPGEPDTHIQICRVVTDGGSELLELKGMGDCFDFAVTAPDSHYFYLCLVDAMGRKTWSCPVWTGKPFQKKKEKKLTPISKAGTSVWDRISGRAVPEIINDDPFAVWNSEHQQADLLLDLGQAQYVSALSHYPYWVDRQIRDQWGGEHYAVSHFPCHYRISVSCDGESFETVAAGHFRIFGSEEFVRFPRRKARYVRLEILSTTGKAYEREELRDVTLTLAEITLWK